MAYAGHFGGRGQGPGELGWASLPWVGQGQLTVYSPQSRMFVTYDLEGNFLQQTPLTVAPFTRFAVFDEMIYVASPAAEKMITGITLDGDVSFQFGEPEFAENRAEKYARNHKHLTVVERSDQPVLLALGLTEPVAEIYDLAGKLLARTDLSNNRFLSERRNEVAEAYAQDPNNKKKSYTLFTDMVSQGNQILALVASQKPPYQILVFELKGDQLIHREVWQIHDSINTDSIAFDGTGSVFIYDARSNQVGRYRMYEKD